MTPLLISGMYIYVVARQHAMPPQHERLIPLSLPSEAVQREIGKEALRLTMVMYSFSFMIVMLVIAHSAKNISTDILAMSFEHNDQKYKVPHSIASAKYDQYVLYMEDGKLSNIEYRILKCDFNKAMMLYIQKDQQEPIQSGQATLVYHQHTANSIVTL
jgi:hypothetical protein